jgi:hypothetical protein
VSTGSVAMVVSGILALYNKISRWRGGYMISMPLSQATIDFFKEFSLTGKHQPKAMFKGCLISSKTFSDIEKDGDDNILLNYGYSAFAVTMRLQKYPVLVLHRQTIRFDTDFVGDEHEVCIYSKYIIPKDKADVQRFDCPNPEEKFVMRPQYEEFIRELSQQLYGFPDWYYLSAEDLIEVSSAK